MVATLAAATTAMAFGALLQAKQPPPPPGVIAASCGDQVVVIDPIDGRSLPFQTGTVGWLYPAPGGVLFAPDLVRGRSTVIDLRTLRMSAQFDGITMPHFGVEPDRYVVVAGDVLVVSYPDRAILARVEAGIESPWQVIVAAPTVVLVLERREDGEGGSSLVAVDPVNGRLAYRRQLPGDVRRIALSRELGLLAWADPAARSVPLVSVATLEVIAQLAVGAGPQDVAFLADGRTLVAATGEGGSGQVRQWVLKAHEGLIKVKSEASVPLSATPARMAVCPLGPWVAVGLVPTRVAVLDLEQPRVVIDVELPEMPRDLVWVDPMRPGPTLPPWSDEAPPTVELGPALPR